MIRRTLYETVVVLLIAVVCAAIAYAFHPGTLPLVQGKKPPQEQTGEKVLFKEMSIEQARQVFSQKKAIFADARSFGAYSQGHIPGAIHLAPDAFDEWSQMMIEQYPPDQMMITYCDGPRCSLARQLAEKLTWLGFENVYHIKDGWGQWKAASMPATMEQ